MSQSPHSPQDRGDKARANADTTPANAPGSGDPNWQAPWVASPTHPEGAAEVPVPAQSSTGHYGPGYADPTRHYGGTLPGRPGSSPAEGETRAATGSRTPGDDTVTTNTAASLPVGPEHSTDADAGEHPTNDPNRPPDFRSEEVGLRPPDHAPSPSAPESENAGLLFERS